MNLTKTEHFKPPYEYSDGTLCEECDDEFFCIEHDLEGRHEQGGERDGGNESRTVKTTDSQLTREGSG